MPISDKNRIYDGWISLEGGVDAGRAPDTIAPNQVQSAINMTFRGGEATTRPGFRKLIETFPNLRTQVYCYNTRLTRSFPVTVNTSSDLFTTATAHFLVAGDQVYFTTTGQRPYPIDPGVKYFVVAPVTATSFKVSNKAGDDPIDVTTPGTGIHSVHPASFKEHAVGEYGAPNPLPNFTVDTVGNLIITNVPHLLLQDDPVYFFSSGSLPAPLEPDTQYFVNGPNITATQFRVSLSPGGANINITNTGTGSHKVLPYFFKDQNSQHIYKHGRFQTALAYSPHHGEDCIMALISGRLFKIVPEVHSARVSEVIIKGNEGDLSMRNIERTPIAYMCQADKWLIAQNGIDGAIIYDATDARRSLTSTDILHTEVPKGTIMSYGMGRLVVIVNDRDVAFGDLYGSHDLPDPADSVILFTERNFLAEGFDAAIPFENGEATGAAFFPQLDTSTGNGQLMVFAERGAASFFMSLPREQWKTSLFQILALRTTGLRGHRTISVVNEDLWFRSDDGVRSYRQARSEQGGYAHIPLSTNVKQYLENDSGWMLRFASSAYFDNRVLMTTSPFWYNARPAHTGLVVVDFDILSSFGQEAKPAWEGQWVFPSFPLQILTGTFEGITRCFVFALDLNNQNQLFELTKDDKDDWDAQRIDWELVSRSFDFQKLSQDSTTFNENELYDGDIWMRDIIE